MPGTQTTSGAEAHGWRRSQVAHEALARIRHWLVVLLRRRFIKALMVANLVALMLLPSRGAGWLQGLELSAYDTLVTMFAGSQESDRVVLVVTTESDINRFGYPIRDNDLSAVLARVFAGAPKAVGVDLYRDLPMPPGNEELQAIQRAQEISIGSSSCPTRAISAFRRRRRCARLAARCWPTT